MTTAELELATAAGIDIDWVCTIDTAGRCARCEQPAYYTVKDAARFAGKSVRTIERWIQEGLRCRTVDGHLMIDHKALKTKRRATLKS